MDLDLCYFVYYCMTRASPVGSPTSSESIDGRHVFNHRLYIGAWPTCAREFVSLSSACRPCLPLQLSSATTFGGSRRILLSLLARGHPVAARGPRVPLLVAPTPLPSVGFLMLFCLLFFYVAWDIVFLYEKLLSL